MNAQAMNMKEALEMMDVMFTDPRRHHKVGDKKVTVTEGRAIYRSKRPAACSGPKTAGVKASKPPRSR